MKHNLSVDNLTLVGDKLDYKLNNLINNPTFDLLGNRYRARYPYEWRFEFIGGGLLEIGSLEVQSDMRIEFNPNKVTDSRKKDMIQKLIGCMKYVRPTRVDIAMDIKTDFDLNDYAVVDSLSRKYEKIFSGLGEVQTQYIGGKSSDLRVRIYNKAKEREDNAGIKVDGNWWRIESQLRREFAENYKEFNPFENITLVNVNSDLSHIKNFTQRMAVKHLLKYPEDLREASKNTRLKYKKILQDLAGSNSKKEIEFHDVFEEYKKVIADTITDYVQYGEKNNVI